MINFTPMNDRVLVRIPEAPEQIGGIYIPQSNYTMRQVSQIVDESVVVAVGPKVKELKPGMKVLTPAREGLAVKIDGTIHRLFKEEEILAIDGRTP